MARDYSVSVNLLGDLLFVAALRDHRHIEASQKTLHGWLKHFGVSASLPAMMFIDTAVVLLRYLVVLMLHAVRHTSFFMCKF